MTSFFCMYQHVILVIKWSCFDSYRYGQMMVFWQDEMLTSTFFSNTCYVPMGMIFPYFWRWICHQKQWSESEWNESFGCFLWAPFYLAATFPKDSNLKRISAFFIWKMFEHKNCLICSTLNNVKHLKDADSNF